MNKKEDINEYIQSFLSSLRMGSQVVFHKRMKKIPATFAKPETPWPKEVENAMHGCGVEKLYLHQAKAVDHVRSGQHVVVATPTASGKTLIYNLPVFEKVLASHDTRALYIFPLKALAQDQLRNFRNMASFFSGKKPDAAIYDGDTTAWHRKKIRQNPPNVLMTNPEMIHLSLLPYHGQWETFFKNLKIVVIDEVHTYRGVMGSHMAQVFRRFKRICAYYGASPVFIFSSATIANPKELAGKLTGLNVKAVKKSGAPLGSRHIVFIDPVERPAKTAILLLKAALFRGLRTIVYTQSRKYAELIAIWAGSKAGPYSNRISAYRAGFLPEERRDIEEKLSNGELLAVISTSALELGIDIGDLDLCLLVGYPGSVMATWQRGGRVGRSGQDSSWVLIAGDDALDQYFMRNPKEFIKQKPEAAVINPFNPAILSKHLACAAAELPLNVDEPFMAEKAVRDTTLDLEKKGELLRSADGKILFARLKAPHRHVDLRGTGSRFNIVCSLSGENRGEVDGFRAFRETHPGAVYLHQGETFIVDSLDIDTMTVKVSSAKVNYYTRVRGNKDTEILELKGEKKVWGTTVCWGRLKVTDQVTGYEKWRIRGHKKINTIPLDLPPQIFETEGIWFKIPLQIQRKAEKDYKHFMGGIHAVEHAAIGILPLFVLSDRNDLGGISIPFHEQVKSAAVFIYDAVPGGAGLSRQAFKQAQKLLETTLTAVKKCPCESGCPGCVHSPKCGSGNRPIDKESAIFLLETIRSSEEPMEGGIHFASNLYSPLSITPVSGPLKREVQKVPQGVHIKAKSERLYYGVFDVETQRSAQEVGGWHKADLMGISCIVLYDSKADRFFEYTQDMVPDFIERLLKLDVVVGFNNKRFDNRVLSGHTDFDFNTLPSLDILEDVHKHLGYRLSLDNLAQITLGAKKSGNGLQALLWWKQGEIRKIMDYCRKDVEITKDLFLYGRKNGYLLFRNKAGNSVRVPVDWC